MNPMARVLFFAQGACVVAMVVLLVHIVFFASPEIFVPIFLATASGFLLLGVGRGLLQRRGMHDLVWQLALAVVLVAVALLALSLP